MADARMSFSPEDLALPSPGPRMAPFAGLGLAVLASTGLWGLLALGVAHLL